MANTSDTRQGTTSSRHKYSHMDENSSYHMQLLNSQRMMETSKGKLEALLNSSRGTNVENAKTYHLALRPKSNDKCTAQTLGSTGGSQPYSTPIIIKKPNLKLNTNIVNQPSIAIPQTTQNLHSSRMTNYQQMGQHGQSRQPNMASTPKSQAQSIPLQPTMAHFNSTVTLTGKHRQQIGSQVHKKSAQVPVMTQDLQSFLPQKQESEGDQSQAKVGTSIPKTTTAANLKNFNNLKQLNQIYNQAKLQASQLSPKHNHNSTSKLQVSNSKTELKSQDSDLQSKSLLLQNHQRHIQQTQLNKTQLHKSKHQGSTDQLITQKFNPKNLQIAIPASPRDESHHDQHQEQKQQTSKIPSSHHAGSVSTSNANSGHIKLNKFTCNSTRNNEKKPNMFGNQGPTTEVNSKEESKEAIDSEGAMALQPAHKIIIPNHETTKHSMKRNGVVRAYAANTNQGLVRNYNEDRVSIILNILKPPNRQAETWPRCSFFGIYDGHGGAACADFLRDNLHQFVIKETSFPSNPKEALRQGFVNAEKKFLQLCQNENGIIDKSGSCAIVVLIVEDMCYVANVGDSRAILSAEQGQKLYPLSRDHKPNDDLERKRIIEAGGQIYHRTATQQTDQNNPAKREIVVGPLRVLPGRLSVSRTFGDAEAKIAKYGGNPNVVIADPEIKSFKITKDHDFIVLGCDGIFDKMSNADTNQCVWNSVKDNKHMNFANDVHKQSGMAVEYILKNSLLRRTLDNVTIVLIAFSNFKHAAFGQGSSSGRTKQRKGTDNYSSQVSTDNSRIGDVSNNAIRQQRKENIPPSSNENQVQPKVKGLQIQTAEGGQMQSLKTTTNAQLMMHGGGKQKERQKVESQKMVVGGGMVGLNTCNGNSKQKHFDFANV